MATSSKTASTASLSALGEMTRFAELRQRLFFLLGALVVYRIGTFIPAPGIDPVALARFFQEQQGTILDIFNMFSGGALERLSIFALGVMPYISASIIIQMMAVVVPQLAAIKKEGESGRRKLTQYTRYGTVAAGGRAGRLGGVRVPEPGRRDRAGSAVRVQRDGHAGRRNDVPDVARRADHRARPRQRHLDDHPCRHRRGLAGGGRRHAGNRPHRRNESGVRADPVRHDHRRDGLRRVRRARPAPHPGQLREAPAGPSHVCRPEHAPAVQAEHVGRDPADLRLEPAAVPGDDRQLGRHFRRLQLAAERRGGHDARVSRRT